MSEVVSLYKCDKCKKLINNPMAGVVVHGNIYVADPTNRGGLIGNNFPTEDIINRSVNAVSSAVKETVLCIPCFLEIVTPEHKITATRER